MRTVLLQRDMTSICGPQERQLEIEDLLDACPEGPGISVSCMGGCHSPLRGLEACARYSNWACPSQDRNEELEQDLAKAREAGE